ncbi:MAG: diapophytoene dehydrogenase [Flavobacteriales bacterium]|nr:diapophytoene dehydrogenase [Flavobacteriales bacterium]
MAKIELIMPKMGESVTEATVISWNKNIGDTVEVDDTIIEVATDKVDSEVPSTHEGILIEQLFQNDDVVQVGEAFAIIQTNSSDKEEIEEILEPIKESKKINQENISEKQVNEEVKSEETILDTSKSKKFYSPLVKSIAKKEGVSLEDLEKIVGTGKEERVTKSDILNYIESKEDNDKQQVDKTEQIKTITNKTSEKNKIQQVNSLNTNTGDIEIVEMDRMRKLISEHMTMSKSTSAHITSIVEADMTNIVEWRNSIKSKFKEREGQNITFTPIIIQAMCNAVKDFPMINVSVDGTNIHVHKNTNIGMAAALPDGNLIVPVIHECQNKNLVGITKSVNDLAKRARSGNLNPDDIQGGTITMTNIGTFGNLMGTPIINQPQVAILACGIIKKKPVVLETEYGDIIAIRHMMYLSLSYDHRVVDGALGGQYIKKVADYLENFNKNQEI